MREYICGACGKPKQHPTNEGDLPTTCFECLSNLISTYEQEESE